MGKPWILFITLLVPFYEILLETFLYLCLRRIATHTYIHIAIVLQYHIASYTFSQSCMLKKDVETLMEVLSVHGCDEGYQTHHEDPTFCVGRTDYIIL